MILYKFYLRAVILTALIFVSMGPTANAASFVRTSSDHLIVLGELEPRDHKNFVRALKIFKEPPTIGLISPGGSIDEAFKIGRLIRELLLVTKAATSPHEPVKHGMCGLGHIWAAPGVLPTPEPILRNRKPAVTPREKMDEFLNAYHPPAWHSMPPKGTDCFCGSACFFLWIAGIERQRGNVAVHRAFIRSGDANGMSLSDYTKQYDNAHDNISQYLEEMSIPTKWFDLIASTASVDIRPLNYEEQQELEAAWPVSIDEWILTKCSPLTMDEREIWHSLITIERELSSPEKNLRSSLGKKRVRFEDCRSSSLEDERERRFNKFLQVQINEQALLSDWASDEFYERLFSTNSPRELWKIASTLPSHLRAISSYILLPGGEASRAYLEKEIEAYNGVLNRLDSDIKNGALWDQLSKAATNFFAVSSPWKFNGRGLAGRIEELAPKLEFQTASQAETALANYIEHNSRYEESELLQRFEKALPIAEQAAVRGSSAFLVLLTEIFGKYQNGSSQLLLFGSKTPDDYIAGMHGKQLERLMETLQKYLGSEYEGTPIKAALISAGTSFPESAFATLLEIFAIPVEGNEERALRLYKEFLIRLPKDSRLRIDAEEQLKKQKH